MKPGLAENIKLLRKKQGWSQAELAEKTDSTLSHINKIETGKYSPSLDALVKLADAFEISLDDLVSGNQSNLNAAELQNKSSSQIARLIDTLDPEDRQTLLGMLKTMLTNKRIQNLVSDKSELFEELAGKKLAK